MARIIPDHNCRTAEDIPGDAITQGKGRCSTDNCMKAKDFPNDTIANGGKKCEGTCN